MKTIRGKRHYSYNMGSDIMENRIRKNNGYNNNNNNSYYYNKCCRSVSGGSILLQVDLRNLVQTIPHAAIQRLW